jgi:hypothetical protein
MLLVLLAPARPAMAASAAEIVHEVNETLASFAKDIGGASAYLQAAKGALVSPPFRRPASAASTAKAPYSSAGG